jgi:hypothetical protein
MACAPGSIRFAPAVLPRPLNPKEMEEHNMRNSEDEKVG